MLCPHTESPSQAAAASSKASSREAPAVHTCRRLCLTQEDVIATIVAMTYTLGHGMHPGLLWQLQLVCQKGNALRAESSATNSGLPAGVAARSRHISVLGSSITHEEILLRPAGSEECCPLLSALQAIPCDHQCRWPQDFDCQREEKTT